MYWVTESMAEIMPKTLLISWGKMSMNESTESHKHGIDEDDLPLFNLIKKISGAKTLMWL